MRTFETGATRDSDTEKIDPEGFLSPVVIEEFSQYMHKNRIQADGSLRDSDNWQKGIPKPAYMKSLWRHFLDVWRLHREIQKIEAHEKQDAFALERKKGLLKEALCAMFFNVQGYLHELLKEEKPIVGFLGGGTWVPPEAQNPLKADVQDMLLNSYKNLKKSPEETLKDQQRTYDQMVEAWKTVLSSLPFSYAAAERSPSRPGPESEERK